MSNLSQPPMTAAFLVLMTICVSQPVASLLLSKQSLLPSSRGAISGICWLPRGSTRKYLELSDILDEDSTEFIDALKRQVEGSNPMNASPREVTNRIKTFFMNTKRSKEEMINFKKYIDNNKSVMDIVNAILLVEGCARSSIKVRDIISWPTILEAMERRSPLLSSSIVYRGISSMRRMDADETDAQKFLRLLWEQTVEAQVVLDDSDICPAIYSMQTLNANSIWTKNFLRFFADALDASTQTFPSKTLCSSVFGLKKMKAVGEVRYLISALARKIISSEVYYHPVNICIALNGLQGMDDSSTEVRSLLTALMEKSISAEEQGIDKAGDREISMALFGLQRMGAKQASQKKYQPSESTPEVLRVLKYLGSLLDSFDQPFEGRRLGFAVMGISGLSSSVPEVQDLVGKIAVRAKDAWGEMNSQELSMCLHGMAGMQSDCANVRSLIAAVVPLVKRCSKMTSNDVRSAMYGFQGMYSSSKEVNDLIAAFADLYERSDIQFATAYDSSTALYSMQGLSSSIPSSRKLLGLVAASVLNNQGRYEGRDISMSLYGLKEFSSAEDETAKALAALGPYIRDFQGSFTVQNVAGALQGLQKMKSGVKSFDSLVGYLAPHVAVTQGVFNSRGLSMALGGLQGLDSKQPDARALIESMAVLMEKSEESFTGFEDFHQISTALNGLSGMSTEYPEVRRLVDSLARLLKPLLDLAPSVLPVSSNTVTTGVQENGVTQVRKWQQGTGVIISTASVNTAISDTDRSANKQKVSTDKLSRMLRDSPKPEKIGMALYGMQGLSSRYDSVRKIMDLLLPFVRKMPPPSGKVVGMAMQGFKACSGRPTGSHAEVLSALAIKLAGWSSKKEKDVRLDRKGPGAVTDVQVTLRSSLWGISRLDRQTTQVREVLKAFAVEVLQWDVHTLDAKTISTLSEVYKGGDIEKEPEVKELLAKISQFTNSVKSQNTDYIKRKKEKNDVLTSNENSSHINTKKADTNVRKSIDSQSVVNIDSVVSSLDGELGFDEVKKYYGMSNQKSIPQGNLYSLPSVIEEMELVEEIKQSRKAKIDARHKRQQDNIDSNPNTDNKNNSDGTTTSTTSSRSKQFRPPRANIEDSPNRGKVWVQKSVRESVTGGTV